MTTPAIPVATALSCSACGHLHSKEAWAYQSGYCHACGARLEIPNPSPNADYSGWTAGPHPRAGILLERAEAIADLVKTQMVNEPSTVPPEGPAFEPPGSNPPVA